MRLIGAHIRGWGRLVDTKINLDTKVIAIVGPNEAGKTTLLKALRHVDFATRLEAAQRSRASSVDDNDVVTSLNFVLDDEDRNELSDLDLNDDPQRMTVSRSASGDRVLVALTPSPCKSVKPVQAALAALQDAATTKKLSDWVEPDSVYADDAPDGDRDFVSEIRQLANDLESVCAGAMPSLDEEAVDIARSIVAAMNDTPATARLRNALPALISWAERVDPEAEVRDRLWKRSPDLILFDEADRSIQSAYTLDGPLVQNAPKALANLVGTAELDLPSLLHFIETDDVARRDSALMQANARMDAIFKEAWKQSRLAVRFSIDGPLLRITLSEDAGNITVFDERSAGLRMFVALIAFLKVHGTERPPILLIDEAENHLHIDAQADLVNMFVTQEQAVKVIYTTHSPACLPPDLGSGIRSVVPRADNHQISEVKNSFWAGSAGYSPLMLAMGAGAAAFTPARCVVLAEGASEMILLPTLLRSATGIESLPYQIAPGLAEVPKDFYPQLDLEAARVVYLADGDDGGDTLAKGLIDSGVPKSLIAQLKVAGVENLLDSDTYRAAITALLPECNPAKHSDFAELPALPAQDAGSWAKHVELWVHQQGLRPPSKVAVANWLVENDMAFPSTAGKRQLKALHNSLQKALRLS